jgi:hypothetical protein
MAEFETAGSEHDHATRDERECVRQGATGWFSVALRRFVLFVSFGPGVLGFLWLIGRILRRWH